MPRESDISRIERLLDEITSLGGQKEKTSIVPNLEVIDASPVGLTGYIIIEDNRDGDYISCRALSGIPYNNGDLVNVIFIEGTEPIAFQQGSGSSTGIGLWQLEGGAGPNIYYNDGNVGVGINAPLAELHIDQATNDAAIPAVIIDQGDISEQCIQFSSDSIDQDINLFTVDVTGDPALSWDEGADTFVLSKGLSITDGNLTLPADIIHSGDTDTKISFTPDQIILDAGGETLLTLTEDVQDVVKIGDGGDVDINFNDDAFLEGSSSRLSIANTSPQKLLHVGNGTDAPGDTNDGIYVASTLATAVVVRETINDVEGTYRASSSGVTFGSITNHDVLFPSNNVTRLTIQADGDIVTAENVGIGNTAPAELLHVGSVGNYLASDGAGNTFWSGSGTGLQFGEISATENSTQTTIAAANTPVQITIFDTNGPSNGATPDHTNDHITISKTGTYLIVCSATIESVAGAGAKFSFSIEKNNGATQVGALHVHRDLSGGGGEAAAISISGIAELTASDTVEAWVENVTNTQNIIMEDIILSLMMIGGS